MAGTKAACGGSLMLGLTPGTYGETRRIEKREAGEENKASGHAPLVEAASHSGQSLEPGEEQEV
ncbi:hypothetical protein DPX16_16579 [Anabarilius grahami]|uniref:Uncharacterized protein n=1 Tax=Anabarilius grahami TaxID=495550 RepID=A0A3N0XV44_ANAGA|nr:hypothetical protein DPX16_16579 [Anabarilius grahami]